MERRQVLVTALGFFAWGVPAFSAARPKVTIYRDPGCGCCGRWAGHMQAAGFEVEIVDDGNLAARRALLGVPEPLASCHTAEVGGYAVEGHVPPGDVARLLDGPPAHARGLAVPGMPVGSPGMEAGEEREPFETILFMRDGTTISFARH